MSQHWSNHIRQGQVPDLADLAPETGARLTLGFYLLSRHALSEWCDE